MDDLIAKRGNEFDKTVEGLIEYHLRRFMEPVPDKRVVHFSAVNDVTLQVGNPAWLVTIDHPFLENGRLIRTSPVQFVSSDHHRIETVNTIYVYKIKDRD